MPSHSSFRIISNIDHVSQRVTVENCSDGVGHADHEHTQDTVISMGTIARLCKTSDLPNRWVHAIDQAYSLADLDLVGRLGKLAAAPFAAFTFHKSVLAQLLYD